MNSSAGRKLTSEEIKLRGSLLARNKDLLRLHKELVFGGMLSEEEFWGSRGALLQGQEVLLNQKRAPSSALTENELRPVAGLGDRNDVKYVLTPAIIQAVFEQHPVLKKAFHELVTDAAAMTEKEFWIEYFKSKFFAGSGQSKAAPSRLDLYYEEALQMGDKDLAMEKEFADRISGQVDISRSHDDHVSDYVRYEQEAAANDPSWNSLRQFNKHSLRVMHGGRKDLAAPRHVVDCASLTDLSVKADPQPALLSIPEPQLMAFGGDAGTRNTAGHFDDSWRGAFLKELSSSGSLHEGGSFAFDYASLKHLQSELLKRNQLTDLSVHTLPVQAERPERVDELASLTASAVEILRHFWRATLLNDPVERHSRTTRMMSVLGGFGERLGKLIEADARLLPLSENLRQVLERAKSRYAELAVQ